MPAMLSLSLSRSAGRPAAAAATPPRPPAARTLAALALACVLASACGGPSEDQFPPACPSLRLVPDAGDQTRFNGQGHDVTNLITRASITAVPAKCETSKPGTVTATLHVDANVARGPASPATPPPIAYFIALMEADKVLQEQDFTLAPVFAPNVQQTTVHGDDIELLLPVSKTKSAAAYRVYVGFRLSADELAYNRTHPNP